MARQNLRNVVQAISIANTAVGEVLDGDDGAEFRKFPAEMTPPILPTRQLTEDNMVGDGRPYPKQGKPYIIDPRSIPYSGALNTTMAHRIIRNFLGGAITPTTRTTQGTIDSAIAMKPVGSEPLVANILRVLGGESLLHADAFVQTLEISQQGMGEPRISANLGNSGHFAKLSATDIDVADIEAMDAYKKYHGNKTTLTFSDGTTSYDFVTERRQLDVTFRGNQGVIVENLMGAPFIDTTNECLGAYSDVIYIDMQSGEIIVKVYMDEDFDEFDAWLENKKLTSVSLTFRTCETIGLTTDVSEIEIKFPIAEFNITPDQQGNFSAYTLTITAREGDPTTGSLIMARIRQVGALDEV